MDRERIVVHQLDDTVYGIVVRCFEVVQISDNYNSRRCNHAFCALFRAVAETIEPKEKKPKEHQINYLFTQFSMNFIRNKSLNENVLKCY